MFDRGCLLQRPWVYIYTLGNGILIEYNTNSISVFIQSPSPSRSSSASSLISFCSFYGSQADVLNEFPLSKFGTNICILSNSFGSMMCIVSNQSRSMRCCVHSIYIFPSFLSWICGLWCSANNGSGWRLMFFLCHKNRHHCRVRCQ